MLGLFYGELMRKIDSLEGKRYLTVDNYMLEKLIDKYKEVIGI